MDINTKCKFFQTSSGAAEIRIIAATGHVFNVLKMLTVEEIDTVQMEAVTADQVQEALVTTTMGSIPEKLQQHHHMMILCATMGTVLCAVPIKQP